MTELIVTFIISEVDTIVCIVVGDSHSQACLENLSSIIIINNNGGYLIYAPTAVSGILKTFSLQLYEKKEPRRWKRRVQ